MILERRFEVFWRDDKPVIKTEEGAVRDLIAMLDLALETTPDDADLLAARSSAYWVLGESGSARRDTKRALKLCPDHAEASALHEFGADWNHVLFLPGWTGRERFIPERMIERFNDGERLQLVRDKLQAALVLILIAGEWPEAVDRYRWVVREAETPYGTIAAHYAILDLDGRIHRQEHLVTPVPGSAAPDSRYPLIGRLAGIRTCFLVLADQEGRVHHSLRYDLPASTRRTLARVGSALRAASGIDASSLEAAKNWHVENFDFLSLGVEE